jgi:HEAT repeat protein
MGLLDKMFGGGTAVEVQLDATQVPVGGILSGRAIVRGGKKDLELTALNVRLLYVSVTTKDDSPLPDIDTRILIDNTLASRQELPAESEREFPFQITIPTGTDPTAHNVRYQVMVVADIPKVKDPSATAELRVIEGDGDGPALSGDQLFSRWPALRGSAENPLVDALYDLHGAIWSERDELIGAEPVLAGLIRQHTGRVRKVALETWAHLLDGHARKEHLKLLGDLAASDLDQETTKGVIEAAAKFADEGALPLVQRYVQHPDPEVRRELAQALHFGGGRQDFPGKRDLVLALAQDPDAEVRAAAFGAFSAYGRDPQMMQRVAHQADTDPSPEVQKACIGALAFCKDPALVYGVWARHLGNPSEDVRKEIAEHVHWLGEEQIQTVQALVQHLLADPSEEVRRAMAWQFRNLSDFPMLAPLLRHTIENDPAERVRKDGLGALASVIPIDEAVAYYRAVLAQGGGSSAIHWAVLDGVRWKDAASAKALLAEMAQSPFPDVARAAREAIESA